MPSLNDNGQTIFTANLMGIAWIASEIIKHLYFDDLDLWPWMKVKVNTINMWCILLSEAFTVPGLTMMTHTHTQTDTHSLGSVLKFALQTKRRWAAPYYGCLLSPGKIRPNFLCIAKTYVLWLAWLTDTLRRAPEFIGFFLHWGTTYMLVVTYVFIFLPIWLFN